MPFQLKKGLNFFYMDVRFLEDPKVRSLLLRFGERAVSIYIVFLCIIYREGYYVKSDVETMIDSISFELGMSGTENRKFIDEVLNWMIQKDLINFAMLSAEGVFTSKAIQRHFYSSTLRRKKQDHPYWLLTPEEEDDLTRYSKGKEDKNND